MLNINLSNINKKLILFSCDFIIIVASITAAFSLRLETLFPFWEINLIIYLIYFITFFFIFTIFNIYQILIRYFDNFSIIKIIKAIFLIQLILVAINLIIYKYIYFPRSVSFIAPIFIGILIIIFRIVLNYFIKSGKNNSNIENNIIIFGVNENTVSLLNSLRQFPNYGVVKGFIDNLGNYKKREINGIKIYKKQDLINLTNKKNISEIIVGSKRNNDTNFKKLFNKLQNKNIRIRKISDTKNYIKTFIGKTLDSNIDFYDIIDRPKIHVDNKILKNKIFNKHILVTGGGGSIGSELCLEILRHKPKKVYILDNSEISLFNIINKIKNIKQNNLNVVKPILGDCNDLNFLQNNFAARKIDEIYHAAAYKHVGFGEENPYSMIKNNVLGSKTIINFAISKKIKHFIFISSDKAVNPKSTLGFSKKIVERLIKYLYDKNKLRLKTNFTIVRFGNVIGSSGSVIPIFLNQITNKRALTVTSKKAKRYFMSISEAVQLVINASHLNNKGVKIYALDMGEQINIFNIAKRIIRLSGNTIKSKINKNGDILIKIIGMKKGEKISEELSLGENLAPTNHHKIFECNEKINTKNLEKDMIKVENSLKMRSIPKNIFKK